VKEFQCREQAQHLGSGFGACDGTPSPVREGRAHAFAAAQHELFDGFGQDGVIRADVRGIATALAQIVAQLFSDGRCQLEC
jgi:hypothetical protein